MPDLDAVGEAMTAAMAGRAVEPATGPAGYTHETSCLNCGSELIGPYCSMCGQHAHVHRTLGAFWHDLLHGVLHFEGKIWRTLPLLAWRPGELTRRYVDGQRARFVSPIALFLFSVFMMFAVFSLLGGPVVTGNDGPEQTPAQERAAAEAEFNRERAEARRALRDLETERARLVAAGESTQDVDLDIRLQRSEIALEERLFKQSMDLIAAAERREQQQAEQTARAGQAAAADPEAAQDQAVLISGADGLNDWFNAAYRKAKENPKLLVYKMQTAAYKFSWLLIPISVPFLWLLFLHRRRYRREFKAYDHTVFVTYSIAFMSLGLILLTLLRPLGLPEVAAVLAMVFVPPIHIYRQLRGTYALSRFSALWRTFALANFASLALLIFAGILLLVGVADA